MSLIENEDVINECEKFEMIKSQLFEARRRAYQ